MRNVYPSTRYKKDLKKYAKQPDKMESLLEIIDKLKNEEPILYPKNLSLIFLRGIIRVVGNVI